MMKTNKQNQFLHFLKEELALPTESIQLALRHSPANAVTFPMTLWQYGLVSLRQLEQIWDWLETTSSV